MADHELDLADTAEYLFLKEDSPYSEEARAWFNNAQKFRANALEYQKKINKINNEYDILGEKREPFVVLQDDFLTLLW